MGRNTSLIPTSRPCVARLPSVGCWVRRRAFSRRCLTRSSGHRPAGTPSIFFQENRQGRGSKGCRPRSDGSLMAAFLVHPSRPLRRCSGGLASPGRVGSRARPRPPRPGPAAESRRTIAAVFHICQPGTESVRNHPTITLKRPCSIITYRRCVFLKSEIIRRVGL